MATAFLLGLYKLGGPDARRLLRGGCSETRRSQDRLASGQDRIIDAGRKWLVRCTSVGLWKGALLRGSADSRCECCGVFGGAFELFLFKKRCGVGAVRRY
jgi:hypothetical protein